MKNIKSFIGKGFGVLLAVSLLVSSPVYATSGESHSAVTYVTIERGDTLYNLSQRYNTSVEKLKSLNNLSSNTIYIGQKLIVSEKEADLYKVIAGSFKQKENAQKRADYIKSKGVDVFITEKVIDNETYYRVQAGAFRYHVNAKIILVKVQKAGISDAFIDKNTQ
ncbi:hypothetical protein BTR23_09515 [Alkalihalophilus pseudofirmus]|nr:hypothetical protein BTR23_09515 [Alkalihalophilus pseudofirmus]